MSEYIKYINYKSFTNDYKSLRLLEVSLNFVCAPTQESYLQNWFWKNGNESNTGSVGTIGFYIRKYVLKRCMLYAIMKITRFISCVYVYIFHYYKPLYVT